MFPAFRCCLCRAHRFNRGAAMEISADQLEQLVDIIRPDYRTTRGMQEASVSEAEFIANVLGDEYGVTGVAQPPSYDFVVRQYLPSEWRARLGVPRMEAGRGEVTRVPPFQVRVLQDLDTLRTSPLAALVYIIARAAGQDNETSMSYARLAQSVASILIMGRRPLRAAHGRSLSSTSLTPRDAPTWRVRPAMPLPRGAAWAQQQLYQQDLVQRGYSEPPAAAGRSRPRPVPHLRR